MELIKITDIIRSIIFTLLIMWIMAHFFNINYRKIHYLVAVISTPIFIIILNFFDFYIMKY